MRATKLRPTPLAKGAGLSPSTLTRALDDENTVSLERRSIQKIVDTYNVPWPPGYGGDPAAKSSDFGSGFADEDLAMASEKDADTPPSDTQADWQIKSRILELAGYLPGDFVRADSSVMPRPNDVVVAQILRTARPGADTVLRLYDPPYLTTATMDERLREKPRPVDNVHVSIWGVVVRSWRVRGY